VAEVAEVIDSISNVSATATARYLGRLSRLADSSAPGDDRRVPAYALFLTGGAVLLTVLATVLSGRLAWARSGKLTPETLSFTGAVLNGLFIVILAFYTVIGWESTNEADSYANAEAAGLANTYWNVGMAPQPQREQIRRLIRDYTTEVREVEWPMLSRGEESHRATTLLADIRTAVAHLPTTPDEVNTARDNSLQLMQNVADQRRQRITKAGDDDNFAVLLLIGTLVGATAMIAFPLVAGLTANARNVMIMAVMGGALAFTCYAAYEIDQPYRGWIAVGPDAFDAISQQFPALDTTP
jgi:hypothetical protein